MKSFIFCIVAAVLLGLMFMSSKEERFDDCDNLARDLVAFVDRSRSVDNRLVLPSDQAPVQFIDYPMNRLPH